MTKYRFENQDELIALLRQRSTDSEEIGNYDDAYDRAADRIVHLSAVVAEYGAWICCHACGGDFDSFLAEQKAKRGDAE